MRNVGEFIDNIMDFFYPRRCPVCDDVLPYLGKNKNLVCEDCKKRIVYIKEPRCRKCGKQLYLEEQIFCKDCQTRKHEFQQGYALYDYESMKESIYRFKYKKRQEYAKFYATQIMEQFSEEWDRIQPEAIIPIPIHKKRKSERGYNQAQVLAAELSKMTGIPMYQNLVIRTKNTKPQKTLGEQGRQNNLKKAFHIPIDVVKLNRIILIDDIYTTGSTIDAVAKELKQHGVGEIFFITLCIGEGI